MLAWQERIWLSKNKMGCLVGEWVTHHWRYSRRGFATSYQGYGRGVHTYVVKLDWVFFYFKLCYYIKIISNSCHFDLLICIEYLLTLCLALAEHFSYNISFNLQKSPEVSIITIPTLQMRKLRVQKVEKYARGYTASSSRADIWTYVCTFLAV